MLNSVGPVAMPLLINNIGPAGLILIALVVLVLFGRGKIASMMGEVGKGITAFKRGVKDAADETEDTATANTQAETIADGSTARDVTPERDRDNA